MVGPGKKGLTSTLTVESPWVVAPGTYLWKLFLVIKTVVLFNVF